MLNFSSSTILQPYKKHLTEAIPWLANELIKKEKILKVGLETWLLELSSNWVSYIRYPWNG